VYVGVKTHLCNVHTCPCTSAQNTCKVLATLTAKKCTYIYTYTHMHAHEYAHKHTRACMTLSTRWSTYTKDLMPAKKGKKTNKIEGLGKASRAYIKREFFWISGFSLLVTVNFKAMGPRKLLLKNLKETRLIPCLCERELWGGLRKWTWNSLAWRLSRIKFA